MDKRFEEMLLNYAVEKDAGARRAIEAQLWREFGAVKTVFVMDLSGFSLLTQKYGIVHYLSMVRRMQLIAQPLIEKAGGRVVKFEADNCFAMFDDPLSAVQTAITLNQAFDEINVYTAEQFDIRVAIGIDHGDVLLIGGPDYFGDSVNTASKLGEDKARPGEILITERAREQLPSSAGLQAEPIQLEISGIIIPAVSIRY
ncbi:MAG: adenylate/guanylate cyclase domain-containing protein [Chloroflexi bacterium]|nr:adenylate/guanylate cyclase domain-containing protein [Chloroflexota bacterium]